MQKRSFKNHTKQTNKKKPKNKPDQGGERFIC